MNWRTTVEVTFGVSTSLWDYWSKGGGGCGMSKAKKFGLIGTGVGFCLALFMSEFAYYANSHHLAYDLSLLYLCLAPTSILLIATERATPSAVATIVLIFALSNGLIYGFVFLVIGKIWDVISR
jgi:FtsH-binding integral membrane protein